MSGLVKVPFRGDEIECVQDVDGVHVSIRRVCDGLGVSVQGQLARLRGERWATIKMILTVADDGKTRETACLALTSLAMWLGTIKASKVKPEAREALTQFQCELHDVVRDHFFGRPTRSDSQLLERFDAMALRLAALEALVVSRTPELHAGIVDTKDAKLFILTPINMIVAKRLRLTGGKQRSVRKKLDDALRECVGYPLTRASRWEMLSREKLGDARRFLAREMALVDDAFDALDAERAAAQSTLFPTEH